MRSEPHEALLQGGQNGQVCVYKVTGIWAARLARSTLTHGPKGDWLVEEAQFADTIRPRPVKAVPEKGSPSSGSVPARKGGAAMPVSSIPLILAVIEPRQDVEYRE